MKRAELACLGLILLLCLTPSALQARDDSSPDPKRPTSTTVTNVVTFKPSKHAWWDQTESRYPPWERGILRTGGFLAAFDTDLSFSLDGAAGITVNAEDLLGLDSSLSVFRVDGLWRFGERKRHTFDFNFSRYHREATGSAIRDIDLGNGTVIPIGAETETVFNFDLLRASYAYAFLQDDRMNLAAGLGVYIAPIEYGLTFTPVNSDPFGLDAQDITLPLPALALRGQFRLTPRLYLITDFDFMYLRLSGFEGSLTDLRICLEYQIWRYFGLGVGYQNTAVDVSASESTDYVGDLVGEIEVGFSGVLLYGKFSF